MSDIDDAADTIAELKALRAAQGERHRDAARLDALMALDVELGVALKELSPRERSDALRGLLDDSMAQVLGALLGPSWERRLGAALAAIDSPIFVCRLERGC